MTRKSLYLHKSNYHRTNYIIHVSKNITIFLNFFDPQLVESMNVEPMDMGGLLYFSPCC